MSARIAKRIRKEISYHPKQERMYARDPKNKGTLLIHPHDKRSLYQEMKKEARA